MKRVIWIFLSFAIFGLLVCRIPGFPKNSPGPEQGAQEWINSIVNQDGNKTLKYTCERQREDLQATTMWFSAISVLGQMLTNKSVQIEGDISDLEFEVVRQSEKRAEVRVYGEFRTAVLGTAQAQQIDERWLMVWEDNTWRWCGNITPQLAEELAYEATATVLADQRDAAPLTTDEQNAAAEIFQQYAQETSLQYRNARYETTNNDGTYAEVAIIAESLEPTYNVWLEFSTVINLRLIGGDWKADTSNIVVTITDAGQQTLEAAQAGAAKATSETIQANLGGILIYVMEDTHSVALIGPDGSERVIPIGGTASINSLEFASDGSGFYFTDRASRIRFHNLETQETVFIKFEDVSIHDFSLSPDNTKLAVASQKGEVWIVPLNGGEAFKIPKGTPIWSLTWSLDSQSLYGIVVPDGYFINGSAPIFERNLNGEEQKVADLPENTIDDTMPRHALALSPNGDEIAFGVDMLGLMRISDGSAIPLDNMNYICNLIWPENDRLMFLSVNKIYIFDIASGQLTNPYDLPFFPRFQRSCDVGFDWLP